MAPHHPRGYDLTDLCTTPECIHLASEILWNLAPNYTEINPCTDFDQLVCGNWAAHNQIPAGQSGSNVLAAEGYQIQDNIKKILQGTYPSGPDAGWITVNLTEEQVKPDKENFEKIQGAYLACMDHTTLEAQGLKTLASFVKEVAEAFPITKGSEPYDHSTAMGNALTLFESLGIETTQRMSQKQNNINPTEIHIVISPPTGNDIPSTDEGVLEYVGHIATILSAVHPSAYSHKEAVSLVENALKLQLALVEALNSGSEEETGSGEDALTPKTSITEVQKIAPQLNYEYVVSKLAPEGYQANKLAATPISYFKKISEVISQTPSDVLQTFFVWKAIIALSPYVESDETNAFSNFKKEQSGGDPESPAPRWQQCTGLIDSGVSWITSDEAVSSRIGPSGLTWILSRFFLDKHYSLEAKKLTSEIVDTLEAAFLERLQDKDWVSPEVKKAAAEKVHAMASLVALPTDPDVLDPIKLKEYYSTVEITSSHAANAISFARLNVARSWETLGHPVSRGKFKYTTLTPNAYQDFQLNTIVLAAGIQQFPIYDVGFPSYIIYGGMGSVVGHELTHGFDNTGRLFDATGNMTTWWDNSTIEAFNKRAECFVEQYNKYTITAPNGTQVHVNGEQTLGENIADAGGVVSSFAAWQKWEKEKGRGKGLPGLEKFTNEQLFFIKWGQNWCDDLPPAIALNLISSDEHSPDSARIKLPLENSAEFKKAFKCGKPEPVCELW
ncbi:hypothetical protein BGZ63DRAFT_455861 [Mariannaea sp. PMI_226]|nr:hypothetical protein BGZ63DRAFT_455861 [Mariannaea sp. PMI_226]